MHRAWRFWVDAKVCSQLGVIKARLSVLGPFPENKQTKTKQIKTAGVPTWNGAGYVLFSLPSWPHGPPPSLSLALCTALPSLLSYKHAHSPQSFHTHQSLCLECSPS